MEQPHPRNPLRNRRVYQIGRSRLRVPYSNNAADIDQQVQRTAETPPNTTEQHASRTSPVGHEAICVVVLGTSGSLWDRAYDGLSKEENNPIAKYENLLSWALRGELIAEICPPRLISYRQLKRRPRRLQARQVMPTEHRTRFPSMMRPPAGRK